MNKTHNAPPSPTISVLFLSANVLGATRRNIFPALIFLIRAETIESLSVEHILPQNPADTSQWRRDFTDEQRAEWTDRLGNLVLITTRKNTAQGNLEYADKKIRYFEKRINSCPNSLRVLNKYSCWTPEEVEENHRAVHKELRDHYGIM